MMTIGLMFVNRALQHGFEDLVDCLYLSVGLRVVCVENSTRNMCLIYFSLK
jgi:hypothetical protein